MNHGNRWQSVCFDELVIVYLSREICSVCVFEVVAISSVVVPMRTYLKEYYEIVGESRPLSAFFPTHADLFTEMHFYS